jgi:hypothetical protein
MSTSRSNVALAKILSKWDSPNRIKWLREQCGGYIRDMATLCHFKLSFKIQGEEVDQTVEAIQAAIGTGLNGGLTADEMQVAFLIEWNEGLTLADKIKHRIEVVAARHIQLYRSRTDIYTALITDRKRWPAGWPHITEDDLKRIAERFQHRPNDGAET